MSGGGKVSAPGPSDEEKALQTEQTALLRQQRDMLSQQMKEQNILAPYFYKQAGVKPIYDTEGNLISVEEIPDPNADIRKEIETGFLKRTQAALKGELPVDPSLEHELSQQEKVMRDTMAANLGPGWETSTPGQEALTKFGEMAGRLRDASRRGDLSTAEGLGIARQQANDMVTANQFQRLFAASGRASAAAPLFGSVMGGFNSMNQQFAGNRAMQMQASMANAQAGASNTAAIGAGVGMVAAAAIMA